MRSLFSPQFVILFSIVSITLEITLQFLIFPLGSIKFVCLNAWEIFRSWPPIDIPCQVGDCIPCTIPTNVLVPQPMLHHWLPRRYCYAVIRITYTVCTGSLKTFGCIMHGWHCPFLWNNPGITA